LIFYTLLYTKGHSFPRFMVWIYKAAMPPEAPLAPHLMAWQ